MGSKDQWVPGDWEKAMAELEKDREFFGGVSDLYQKSMAGLEDDVVEINRKIDLYEGRKIRIRREIEAYFDKDD
jgi:hypothetical protein